jgi:APA family basic amino acid/polyamine antiporter
MPMKAVLTADRPAGPEWVFERKLDGIRCLAVKDAGRTRLYSRNELSLNERYAPLAAAVDAGSLAALEPAVRVGAAIASLGVLLSLIAGVSRTALAMGRRRDLPAWLAAVHPAHRVPHHAEIAVGAIVVALILTTDLRSAIGFSSFTVLGYYTIANASAWTLPRGHARGSRLVPAVGIIGCLALAFALPGATVIPGIAILGAGAAAWAARQGLRQRH